MYFFDLDGTILDSNGVWTDIDARFLGQFGIRTVPEDYKDYVTHHKFPDAAAYTRTRYDLPLTDGEIMDSWERMAREAYSGLLPLKPGVKDFLRRAAEAGIRCALLTSCLPELCTLTLEGHGLTQYFERVFTTVELDMEKGSPELFRHLSRLCGEKPEDCVLFDDSPVYCAAAKEAGWVPCGMDDPLFRPQAEKLRAICGEEHYPFSFLKPLP